MSLLAIVCSVSCGFYVVFGRVVLPDEAFLLRYSVAFRPRDWGFFGPVRCVGLVNYVVTNTMTPIPIQSVFVVV